MFKAYAPPPAAHLNRECISCTPPEHDPETVGFTAQWKLVLHPSQCGLGNVLLVARRHVARMAELRPDEWEEFQNIVGVIEPALEAAFGASLINLAYQRNWAYRMHDPDPPLKDRRPNPHVHWHVTPRYAAPIRFERATFDDPTFGEPFEWRETHVSVEVRRAILNRLQERLEVVFVTLD